MEVGYFIKLKKFMVFTKKFNNFTTSPGKSLSVVDNEPGRVSGR